MTQLNVLLTGVTGAVGRELLAQLLSEGYRVFCIIRPNGGLNAVARLKAITTNPSAVALAGDITLPGCGVDFGRLSRIDKVIHCAADVRFDDQYAEEITATNIFGTRNMLALAGACLAPEFHYVGTTYIAGDARSLDEAPVGQAVQVGKARNAYEATKLEAEMLARSWRDGRVSIYRPSIVIGRASDGISFSFDGYYGFFKGLWRFARRLRSDGARLQSPIRLEADGQVYLPIRIKAVASTRLNLIQSDWLGRTMGKLIALPARGEAFNLAHPTPLTVGEVIAASLDAIGIAGATVSEELPAPPKTARQFASIQRAVTAGLGRYSPYVNHGPRFVGLNAERLLGADFVAPPPVTASSLAETLRYAISVWGAEDDPAPVRTDNIRHIGTRAA